MILGIYILKSLGFNLKESGQVIEGDDGPLKWSSLLILDLGTYEFKNIIQGKLHPENHL